MIYVFRHDEVAKLDLAGIPIPYMHVNDSSTLAEVVGVVRFSQNLIDTAGGTKVPRN